MLCWLKGEQGKTRLGIRIEHNLVGKLEENKKFVEKQTAKKRQKNIATCKHCT